MDGKITKNTGKSVSEKHKIKMITPAFIAYVATLVSTHTSLSASTNLLYAGSLYVNEPNTLE